jgi:hypothetical protein
MLDAGERASSIARADGKTRSGECFRAGH